MGLFEDFEKVSTEQWNSKIASDLKGKKMPEEIVWESFEGISVQPFYNKASLDENRSSKSTTPKKNRGWLIRETIYISSPEEANKKALNALKDGTNSLLFVGEIKNIEEAAILLKDVQTEIVDINFYNPSPLQHYHLLKGKKVEGSISYDYLGELLLNGNWQTDEQTDLSGLTGLVNYTKNRSICVQGINYNNAGATIVQELAFSLSQAVEYFSFLTDKKISPDKIAQSMHFNFGIGSNYFFEIAKLRAARILWQLILKEYKIDTTTPMVIHSETSNWNLTDKSPYTNMLRVTTESMSAIIGGCDSLTVTPYNTTFENSSNFSERIARNTQIVLKEEAFLDKVDNPADGAYYIEKLTDEIAEKAWGLFQKVELQGGFLVNIKNGVIQKKIQAAAEIKNKALQDGSLTLLGANKYIHEKEAVISNKSINASAKKVTTAITPLTIYRAAEVVKHEKLNS